MELFILDKLWDSDLIIEIGIVNSRSGIGDNI